MHKYLTSVAMALGAFVLLISCSRGQEQSEKMKNQNMDREPEQEGMVYAPEFPDGMDWLNTDRPLKLKDLKGKFVILDFWTYCCINCMHVIPDLKKLERKYSDELVVIGVHSAKFTNEQGTNNIRQAILRYEIEHPVVNDKDFAIWEEYTVNAWPTLVLINPGGKIIRIRAGEGAFETFDPILARAIPYFESKGQLTRGALKFDLEAETAPTTLLSYPGKVHASSETNQLYITDTNNNRIIVATPTGEILDVIGSGAQGTANGAFEAAEFNKPQGTFLKGNMLYIADTENHMIRAANLKTRKVETIFGTGEQGMYFDGTTTGKGVTLNSPWDVLAIGTTLYIAMAGSHQIWAADLATGKVRVHAGSGREGRQDGALPLAALAQPSALTTDGKKLYFADSETSSIRWADLDPDGDAGTIVGKDLFDFGDVDGDYHTARFQHPLGVVYSDGTLYAADTYNSKVKVIDIAKRTSMTLSGVGRHGYKNGAQEYAEYNEPGGIAALGDALYIADTNNHMIRVLNRQTGKVTSIQLSNIDKLSAHHSSRPVAPPVVLAEQNISPGRRVIKITVPLPDGYKLTEDAPHSLDVQSENAGAVTFEYSKSTYSTKSNALSARYEVDAKDGQSTITISAVVYYCEKTSDVCMIDRRTYTLPVRVNRTGNNAIDIRLPIRGALNATK